MVLSPTLHIRDPQGFAAEAALEDVGLPPVRDKCGGGTAVWIAGNLGGIRYSGELAARAAANMMFLGLVLASGNSAPSEN